MTIWDCRTHVPMTSMTSLVERTDLDFKISVALVMNMTFISSHEEKKLYISFEASPLMKCLFFTSLDDIKVIFIIIIIISILEPCFPLPSTKGWADKNLNSLVEFGCINKTFNSFTVFNKPFGVKAWQVV